MKIWMAELIIPAHFTYFYSLFVALRGGGCWAFNIASMLGEHVTPTPQTPRNDLNSALLWPASNVGRNDWWMYAGRRWLLKPFNSKIHCSPFFGLFFSSHSSSSHEQQHYCISFIFPIGKFQPCSNRSLVLNGINCCYVWLLQYFASWLWRYLYNTFNNKFEWTSF